MHIDPADKPELENISKRMKIAVIERREELQEYFATHGGAEKLQMMLQELERLDRENSPVKPKPQNQNQPKNNNAQNVQKPEGKNWIKDNSNGIYMQNPSPSEGETISWSGGFVHEGGYKFADGSGTTVWRNKSGEVVQVDEGSFQRGRRVGKFKHQFFPSGNVNYSEWKNGQMIR